MRIALYEPDIPQNCGALIRLGACLGVAVDIIEPCGFLFSDKGLKRAGMDYVDSADIVRHTSWARFYDGHRQNGAGRLILLTSKGADPYTGFAFSPGDVENLCNLPNGWFTQDPAEVVKLKTNPDQHREITESAVIPFPRRP